jgi:BASS family bile acid:Na+ symporter
MLQRYLIVWLCLLSLAAYEWPTWFGTAADPFLASKPWLQYLFAMTMLAVGWMLRMEEVRQVFARWPMVLAGTATQYTVMPLLGYVVGQHMPGLTDDQRIGLVMVGCVPGAMASNVLTMAARGNVSYSVSLTTSSTLLSPLVVPLALKLTLGKSVELDPWAVSWDLCWTVVIPVVVGHLLGRVFSRWEQTAERIGSSVANLTILWIIACVVALNRERLVPTGVLLVALVAINLLGYLGGYLAGAGLRLPMPMTRALTLEVGMQNAGLGTVLALRFFPDRPAITIPCALYTFGCVFTALVLAQAWCWWDDRRQNGSQPASG